MSKKKIISLIMTILLVSTMVLSAGAVGSTNSSNRGTRQVVTKIIPASLGDYIGHSATDPEQSWPDAEIIIPLMKKGFEDETGSLIEWDENNELMGPTVSQLRKNSISLTLNVAKGKKFIRDVQLVNFSPTKRIQTRSAIRIRFVEEHVSTEEFDYEFTVGLSLKGNPSSVSETFGGRFTNPIYYAYSKDYVFVGDGMLIHAEDTVDELEADLGAGVTAFLDVTKNEKYYGTAKALFEKDERLAKYYPEITDVYELKVIGMQKAGNYFVLEGFDAKNKVFVYNTEGEYIGMSNEKLPFSERYYLSSTEIEIDTELVEQILPKVDKEVDTYTSAALKSFNDGLEEDQKLPGAPTED